MCPHELAQRSRIQEGLKTVKTAVPSSPQIIDEQRAENHQDQEEEKLDIKKNIHANGTRSTP